MKMTPRKEEIFRLLIEKIKNEETETLNFLLPSFLVKGITAYVSMKEDLSLVLRQANLLLELNIEPKILDPIIRETVIPALWYSTIITYGRCFTAATQSANSSLEKNACFSAQDSQLLEIHEFLMDIRNNFVAHRGDTDNELAIVFMKVPKGEITAETAFSIKSVRTLSPSTEILQECLKLFSHIQVIVENKIQKQTEKVRNRFLSEFTSPEMMHFLIK
jgi:hypothetical protein